MKKAAHLRGFLLLFFARSEIVLFLKRKKDCLTMTARYGFLLVLTGLCGCAVTTDSKEDASEATLSRVYHEHAMQQHLDEWEQIKPEINELLVLKQDLELLITALSLPAVSEEQNPQVARSIDAVDESPQIKEPAEEKVPALPDGKFFFSNNAPAFHVHLASYLTLDDAKKGWAVIQNRAKPLLDNAAPFFESVTVNGTDYISLRAGPFESATDSRALCAALKQQKQYCALVLPNSSK